MLPIPPETKEPDRLQTWGPGRGPEGPCLDSALLPHTSASEWSEPKKKMNRNQIIAWPYWGTALSLFLSRIHSFCLFNLSSVSLLLSR
jgi:hypothetical protein